VVMGWIQDLMADAPILEDEELEAFVAKLRALPETPTHAQVCEELTQIYYSRPHPTWEEDPRAHLAFRAKCDIVADMDADTLLSIL